jgi:hypothetical protein
MNGTSIEKLHGHHRKQLTFILTFSIIVAWKTKEQNKDATRYERFMSDTISDFEASMLRNCCMIIWLCCLCIRLSMMELPFLIAPHRTLAT